MAENVNRYSWKVISEMRFTISLKILQSHFYADYHEKDQPSTDIQPTRILLSQIYFTVLHIIDQVNTTRFYSAFAHNANVPSLRIILFDTDNPA